MKVLHTVELEPGAAGSTIHFRYGAPRTRREKELMATIGPAYGHALESSLPGLVAQLDAELGARTADPGLQPEPADPSQTPPVT